MRCVCTCLAICAFLLGSLGCSGDDDPKDASTDIVDLGQPDTKGVDVPFGRACTNFGKECPDKDPEGFTLWCIGLKDGSPGKGFCTRQCTDVGVECYGVPNGQWAQCFIQSEGGDAGPDKKYCGFLCASENKTWGCPGTLTCGDKDSQGTALCLP